SRETALLAQHVEQARQRVGIDASPPAVDPGVKRQGSGLSARVRLKPDTTNDSGCTKATSERAACINFSGVAGISRTSMPACRSALMTAGAGPSIGISPTPFAPNGPCAYGFPAITISIGGVSSVVGMM